MITKGNMTIFFSENDPFSNWFRSDFEVKGVRFNCVEQFMMYCKAKLFGDETSAGKIMAAMHPRDHKAIGRNVSGYDDATWCERRSRIVAHGCYAKFSQNPVLRDALLATADTVLVEASPYDRVWGVGLAEHDPRVLDPSQWNGLNLLGIALTHARERLVADLSVKTNIDVRVQPEAANPAKPLSMRMG
ncbi:NADAR family protein [Pseudomonas sp. W22_MBD1_FP4]|uniref:NADAR family protein n=1 Tax=Pseudomonas sp. W22_MBD1_FP4 TaxID=3240272 RepID=UPI003F96E235